MCLFHNNIFDLLDGGFYLRIRKKKKGYKSYYFTSLIFTASRNVKALVRGVVSLSDVNISAFIHVNQELSLIAVCRFENTAC